MDLGKSPLVSRLIFLFLIAFFSEETLAQSPVLKQARIENRCELEGASSEVLDSFYLGLPPVSTSPHKYHFRFSRNGQRLDLWSEDSVHFEGLLTNYTIQYRAPVKAWKENSGNKKYQYFYTQISIDTSLAAAAFKHIWESGQAFFPTDSWVEGWKDGYLDCSYLFFYFKNPDYRNSQKFYCPWGQSDTISIKKIILENEAYLLSHFQLDTSDRKFRNKLPPNFTYSKDGFTFLSVGKWDKESQKRWQASKIRLAYLKKVKPEIDAYLNAYVKTRLPAMPLLDCNPRFWIYFDALGKFQKVMVQDYDKPKWEDRLSTSEFLSDKRNLRRCKAQVEKLFKKADLSFLRLQWGFWRTISFNSTGFEIEDNNGYP